MFYRLAVETGLRAGEIRSLTPESLRFDDEPPTVIVQAACSKHRREDVQPVPVRLAANLRPFLANRAAGAPVFAVPASSVEMLPADLEDVGIAYRDDAGRVVDFHALRHTFVTNLARGGARPKDAQALARHSTITLTMDRYAHTVVGAVATALEVLPDLSDRAPQRQRRLATGTDDAAAGAPRRVRTNVARILAAAGIPSPVMTPIRTTMPRNEMATEARLRPSLAVLGIRRQPLTLTRRAGLEPTTFGLEIRCSVRLSYRRKALSAYQSPRISQARNRRWQAVFTLCSRKRPTGLPHSRDLFAAKPGRQPLRRLLPDAVGHDAVVLVLHGLRLVPGDLPAGLAIETVVSRSTVDRLAHVLDRQRLGQPGPLDDPPKVPSHVAPPSLAVRSREYPRPPR